VNISNTKFHENIPVAVALIQADPPTTGDKTQTKGIFSDYAEAANRARPFCYIIQVTQATCFGLILQAATRCHYKIHVYEQAIGSDKGVTNYNINICNRTSQRKECYSIIKTNDLILCKEIMGHFS